MKAFISGCAGLALSDEERAFFREARPLGLILFGRNCDTPEQIRALTDDFRECLDGDPVLVLIDQEGGRVQRLKPPNWPDMPPARAYGELYACDRSCGQRAAFFGGRLIAEMLYPLGINVDCAPVLDVPHPGSHDIIGDRAFAHDPHAVANLGRAMMEGLLCGGVLPVVKHVPGHGRAKADSHLSLPVIEACESEMQKIDFCPFEILHDAPLAMTAHVLIPALDATRPASTSPVIINQLIRKVIGLKGLLMCDDLGMKALEGGMAERARAVIAAGCDVALHCSGDLAEMRQVADAVPELQGLAALRFEHALGELRAPRPFDHDAAERLMARVRSNRIAAG